MSERDEMIEVSLHPLVLMYAKTEADLAQSCWWRRNLRGMAFHEERLRWLLRRASSEYLEVYP